MARNRKIGAKRRKEKRRYEGDTVLIVCEGDETEPNYLHALKEHLQLHNAAVEIADSSGSAPISVVESAKRYCEDACSRGEPFAKVFCVIDKDTHPTYQNSLQAIKDFNKISSNHCATILCAIPSVPCFEYWILMHFIQSTALYGTGSSPPCNHLISSALKKHIPNYSKTDRARAKELIETRLKNAMRNSRTTLRAAKSAETDNPSTHMHLLVEELEYLKNNGYFEANRKGCPS